MLLDLVVVFRVVEASTVVLVTSPSVSEGTLGTGHGSSTPLDELELGSRCLFG